MQVKRRHLCINHNHHQTIIIIINTALSINHYTTNHQYYITSTSRSLAHNKAANRPVAAAAPNTSLSLVWVDSFYLSVVEVLVHDILVVLDVAFVLRCFCIIFCPSCRGDLYGVRHFVVQMVLSSFHAGAREQHTVHDALV